MKKFSHLSVFFVLLFSFHIHSANEEHQNLESLTDLRTQVTQQTQMFVENTMYAQGAEHLSVSVFPLDKRIKVEPCQSGYQYEFSNKKSITTYSTVKASCDENDWFIFLNVKVEHLKQVVITGETLSPGTLLTQQNLTIADINTQKLRHTTFSHIEDLTGARLKYRVRHGQPITPNMVCFVCKGDVITLSARSQGLSISTKGIAQQDGNRGDTIKVKNSRSDKVVLARVMNHNTAIISI